MSRDRLPTGLRARAAATARIGLSLARNGASRALSGANEAADAALGERLFAELDALKGLAMKVGQILSYLDAGLPEGLSRRLEALQEGVSPLAAEVVVAEIERGLRAPLAARFDRFDLAPVAAASIGQVHRGRVGDQEVAIKVRYPGIRDTLEADTRQLRSIARLASVATAVDGQALVTELRARILEECDYAHEARMQERFGALLQGDDAFVVPAVFADRCCETVLTTAWWDGARFASLRDAPPARRDAFGLRLARLPWTTLLRHRLLHADPHPGNFLFAPDGRLVVLDFGCVKEFSAESIAAFGALVEAVRRGDRDAAFAAAARLGLTPRPERLDAELLWAMLAWLFAPYCTTNFQFHAAWWHEGRAFSRPGNANARHLGITPDWLWLQRTLFGLHAVLTRLGAQGDFAALVDAALDRRVAVD